MRNNMYKDERVVEQQRKIASDAFQLVSIFLLFSILYKQFILHESFKAYMIEFIAFFGGAFYVVIRNVMKGNDTIGLTKRGIRMYLINSLFSSITITIVIVLSNNKENFQLIEIIIGFIIAFTITFLSSYGLSWLSRERANKLAKQYERDE